MQVILFTGITHRRDSNIWGPERQKDVIKVSHIYANESAAHDTSHYLRELHLNTDFLHDYFK